MKQQQHRQHQQQQQQQQRHGAPPLNEEEAPEKKCCSLATVSCRVLLSALKGALFDVEYGSDQSVVWAILTPFSSQKNPSLY